MAISEGLISGLVLLSFFLPASFLLSLCFLCSSFASLPAPEIVKSSCVLIFFVPRSKLYTPLVPFPDRSPSFVPTSNRLCARSWHMGCLLYTSPSPRDRQKSRMPSSA